MYSVQFWMVHTALFSLFVILCLWSIKPNTSKECQIQMFEFTQCVQIDRWSLSPQTTFAPFRLLVNFSLINVLLSRALALRLVFTAFWPKNKDASRAWFQISTPPNKYWWVCQGTVIPPNLDELNRKRRGRSSSCSCTWIWASVRKQENKGLLEVAAQ